MSSVRLRKQDGNTSDTSQKQRQQGKVALLSRREATPFSDGLSRTVLKILYPVLLVSLLYMLSVILIIGLLLNFVQFLVAIMGKIGVLSSWRTLWVNQLLSNQWWMLVTWGVEGWGHVTYRFTGDDLSTDRESCMTIGNHGPGMDIVSAINTCNRSHGSGRTMTLIKKSLRKVPVLGFCHYFQGSLFLDRNWDKDEAVIQKKCIEMENGDTPGPFVFGIYPEGTRITPKKREESQKFARERGNLPILNHVLMPRTKGFCFICKHFPTAIKYVNDCTIGYRQEGLHLIDVLKQGYFGCAGVDVHIRRIPWKELPIEDEKKLSAWLINDFKEKDDLIQYLHDHGKFPGRHVSTLNPPLATLSLRFLVASFVCNAICSYVWCGNESSWVGGYGWVVGIVQAFTLVWPFLFRKDVSKEDDDDEQ